MNGFFLCFILSSLCLGCSRIAQVNDCSIASTIQSRIDKEVHWYQGCHEANFFSEFIEALIHQEITADSAIQIALLNNPKVQAIFEELGIAQADLVEAGLLSNPFFEIEIRYPHVKGLRTNIEYLLTTSLLDIFLIPLKTKLASIEFEQVKLKISHEILNLAFDVSKVYYELIAEKQKIGYLQSIVELNDIIQELSSRQSEAGNVNTLDLQLAQFKSLEAKVELSQSQGELIHLKEKLNKLLGFEQDLCLILPESLPEELDCHGYDLSALESLALEGRLDIQVARIELTRLCQMLGLKSGWTYTNLRVGLAGEREPEGAHLIGPGFSGEIPIFNYGQAARLRLYAQYRQAQNLLSELEIRVLSEVREAYKLFMNYFNIVLDYKNGLLPAQQQVLISSNNLYNVMGLGIDQLLESKRQEAILMKNYTEAVKRYLINKVELDRALGGLDMCGDSN